MKHPVGSCRWLPAAFAAFALALAIPGVGSAGDPAVKVSAASKPAPNASGKRPKVQSPFALTGRMAFARVGHTASPLLGAGGQVLIAGGGTIGGVLGLAEIFDPSSGTFSEAPGAMVQSRKDHTATLLGSGKVLIAGGDDGFDVFDSAELFDASSSTFAVTPAMFAKRTFHTATLLNNGRVLVLGGAPSISPPTANNLPFPVPLGALDTAEVFDGHQFLFNPNSMSVPRAGHAAAAINNRSQVLVIGGLNNAGVALRSAEIYTVSNARFSITGSLSTPRTFHTATLLSCPAGAATCKVPQGLRGSVLITGGLNSEGPLRSAEIYTPKTQAFTSKHIGLMNEPRAFHTATLLPDGRVLLAGGSDDSSAETFDPSTEQFSCVGGASETGGCKPSTAAARDFEAATALSDGTVLLTGGATCCAADPALTSQNGTLSDPSAETFDPSKGTFNPDVPPMVQPRAFHTATALTGGKILIAGGEDTSAAVFDTAELYDPANGTFVAAGGTLTAPRSFHAAAVLACAAASAGAQCFVPPSMNGMVLLAGGITFDSTSAELFNPSTGLGPGSFSPTGSMTAPRIQPTATTLNDGRVLVAGGEILSSTPVMLTSAELYDPSKGQFSCVGGSSGNPAACNSSLQSPRFDHTATLLPNGKVLLAGGAIGEGLFTGSAELFDPVSNTFTATGSMSEARFLHSAVLLDPNVVSGPLAGKVLVVGGSPDQSAEIYDPGSGQFTPTSGNTTAVRFASTANLLTNGQVLITGGYVLNFFGQIFPQSSAELFDPATSTFKPAGNMTTARALHTATLLSNGKTVLVGGRGVNETLSSAELFTPP